MGKIRKFLETLAIEFIQAVEHRFVQPKQNGQPLVRRTWRLATEKIPPLIEFDIDVIDGGVKPFVVGGVNAGVIG